MRCPGCCNPEMLPFEGGVAHTVDDVVAQLAEAAKARDVEGITLLGGEPFAHAKPAASLAMRAQALGFSVMIFSGYTRREIEGSRDPFAAKLFEHTDLLVDGRYDAAEPETDRRWIGSANQRVHFLSDRYDSSDPRWREPNTLEIRFDGEAVTVNGFPAANAVGMWRRLTGSHETS